MDDTSDNESDNDDKEEIPNVPRNGAAKNGAPPRKRMTSQKESERKKRELITIGKAKGFLTYDEVNAQMPEGVTSPDQMEDWLSAFTGEGIEIVESSSKIKVVEKGLGEVAPEEDEDEEVAAKREKAKEEEEAGGHYTSID